MATLPDSHFPQTIGWSPISWPPLGMCAVPVILLLLVGASVLLWVILGWTGKEVPSFPPPLTLLQRDGWHKARQWWSAAMGEPEQRAVIWHNLALTAVIVGLVPVLSMALILAGSAYEGSTGRRLNLLAACVAAGAMILLSALLQLRLLLRLAACRPVGKLSSFTYAIVWLFVLGARLLRIPVFLCRVGRHLDVSSDRRRASRHLAWNGLLSLAGWTLAIYLLAAWWTSDRSARVLFAERTTLVATGHSVLPPLLLLAVGFVVFAYYGLRRQHIDHCFRIDCPYPNKMDKAVDPTTAATCSSLHQESLELQDELASFAAFRDRCWRWLLVAGCALILAFGMFWYYSRPTYEGTAWDTVFLIGFLVLTWGVVFNVIRLLTCWMGFEALLKRMALLPMVQAFDRLPRKVADLFGGYFRTRLPRGFHLVIPLSILRQLRSEASQARRTQAVPTAKTEINSPVPALAQMPDFNHCPAHIEDTLTRATAWPDPRRMEAEEEYPGKSLNTFSHDAQKLVQDLVRYWPHHSIPNAYGDEPADTGVKKGAQNSPETGEKRTTGLQTEEEIPFWVQKAEDFVAIQAIIFLSQFFIQLRALAACAVWGSVLLLLAATAYPFQPEQLIMELVFTLLLAVAGSTVWVLVRGNKNEIISRITRSTPNKLNLNWTFTAGMLQYVGPIVLVLLVSMSGRMRTLIEPLLNVIR